MEKIGIKKDLELLKARLHDNNVIISAGQLLKFKKYIELIRSWNRKINLISRKDVNFIVNKHILECLTILDILDIPPECRIIDVGTGAGLPGIPLKIMRPDLSIVLLDSKRMKHIFLNKVVHELNLRETTPILGRSESLSIDTEFAGTFDMVISRAVADLSQLFQWSHSFLSRNGIFVALKGGHLQDEIERFESNYPECIVDEVLISSGYIQKDRNLKLVVIKKLH